MFIRVDGVRAIGRLLSIGAESCNGGCVLGSLYLFLFDANEKAGFAVQERLNSGGSCSVVSLLQLPSLMTAVFTRSAPDVCVCSFFVGAGSKPVFTFSTGVFFGNVTWEVHSLARV